MNLTYLGTAADHKLQSNENLRSMRRLGAEISLFMDGRQIERISAPIYVVLKMPKLLI